MARPTLGIGVFGQWAGSGMRNANLQIARPPQWHYRLPWFMTADESGDLVGTEDSQAIQDARLHKCYSAGIDYYIMWGIGVDPEFPMTGDGNMDGFVGDQHWAGFNAPLYYYLRSDYKDMMPYALVTGIGCMGRIGRFNAYGSLAGANPSDWAHQRDWLIERMQDSNYFKVDATGQGGYADQPLLYFFTPESTRTLNYVGDAAAMKTDLDDLVTRANAVGVYPYIVAWGDKGSTTFAWSAQGNYGVGPSGGSAGETYSALRTRQAATWTASLTGLPGTVPNCTVGQDYRCIANTAGYPNSYVLDADPTNQANANDTPNWVVQPTPAELAAHVLDAFAFVEANAKCYVRTVSLYALTENLEGTIGLDPTASGGAYLQALSNILGQRDPKGVYRRRGMAIKTR